MPVIEVVWRHLLVSAREGRRRWPSVTALAGELGLAVSTTHRSLAHPIEIGALEVGPIDGLQVLDPARLLVLLAAHRHVQRDVVAPFMGGGSRGGGRGGRHQPAVSCWEASERWSRISAGTGSPTTPGCCSTAIPSCPDLRRRGQGNGTEVWVAEPDAWLSRYGRVTPLRPGVRGPVLDAGLAGGPIHRTARSPAEWPPRDEPVLLV